MTFIVKPPQRVNGRFRKSVFLAGSIEMGAAENWQERVSKELEGLADIIYNPRRDDWDASWKQEASNPQFREQVLWELHYLEEADYIFMYLDPNTKSPISLLELGLFQYQNIRVVCPEEFYRRGNVEIVCEQYLIPFYDTLEEGLNEFKKILE